MNEASAAVTGRQAGGRGRLLGNPAAYARPRAAELRAHRHVMDQAFDPHWLARADLRDTAVLWRIATIHALSGDQRAKRAMRLAQQRLAHPTQY